MAKPADLIKEATYSQLLLLRYETVTDHQYLRELQDFKKRYFDDMSHEEALSKGVKELRAQVDREISAIYKNLESNLENDNEVVASISFNSAARALKTHADELKAGSAALATPVWTAIPKNAVKAIISLHKLVELQSVTKPKVTRTRISPHKEIKKLSKKHRKFYRQKIIEALILGEGIEEVVRDLKAEAGAFDSRTRSQVASLVRTTISGAMARSREYAEDNYFSDISRGYMWISTLDLRVTFECASRHGLIRKSRSQFNGVPPLHWGCRSILTMITDLTDTDTLLQTFAVHEQTITGTRDGELRSKFKLKKDGFKKFPNPKAKDPNSKKSTFDYFFKNLTEQEKRDYLGPQRYKIYKKYGLTTSDLVTGGRKKSVKEITQALNLNEKEVAQIKSRKGVPKSGVKKSIPAQRIIKRRKEARQKLGESS